MARCETVVRLGEGGPHLTVARYHWCVGARKEFWIPPAVRTTGEIAEARGNRVLV